MGDLASAIGLAAAVIQLFNFIKDVLNDSHELYNLGSVQDALKRCHGNSLPIDDLKTALESAIHSSSNEDPVNSPSFQLWLESVGLSTLFLPFDVDHSQVSSNDKNGLAHLNLPDNIKRYGRLVRPEEKEIRAQMPTHWSFGGTTFKLKHGLLRKIFSNRMKENQGNFLVIDMASKHPSVATGEEEENASSP